MPISPPSHDQQGRPAEDLSQSLSAVVEADERMDVTSSGAVDPIRKGAPGRIVYVRDMYVCFSIGTSQKCKEGAKQCPANWRHYSRDVF